MKKSKTEKILYWSPRILGILLAAFISLFALDVFGEGYGFWGTIAALLIHLVPTFMLIAVLAVAWKLEHIGGALFIGLGILYIVLSGGRQHYLAYLLISGPAFLTGALFILHKIVKKE